MSSRQYYVQVLLRKIASTSFVSLTIRKIQENDTKMTSIIRLAEKDREALKEIYQTIIGSDVDFNEYIYKEEWHLYSCELQGGGVALDSLTRADAKGQITGLNLLIKPFPRNSLNRKCFFDLSEAIGKLEHLEELALHGCESLPKCLSRLPNLKTLSITHSPNIFRKRLLLELRLPYLMQFRASGAGLSHYFDVHSYFPWIQEHLPSLQTLELRSCFIRRSRYRGSWRPPLFKYKSHKCLERILMERWDVDENDLASMFFDVLPYFPKVTKINLSHNNISSFGGIKDRLQQQKALHLRPRRLLTLNIDHNPLLTMTKVDELCAFLRSFNVYIPATKDSRFLHHHDVQREHLINITGRNLVQTKGENIPFALWPTILAQMSQRGEPEDWFDATGMYFLLRNSFCMNPTLLSRNTRSAPKNDAD